MYSILIENGDTLHYYSQNGEIWSGSKAEAQVKYIELLAYYSTKRLVVVHNTTIDLSAMTITDIS